MKQKLYHLSIGNYVDTNKEIEFPNKLQELISDGWYIKTISAYPFEGGIGAMSGLTLLLQKD